MRLLIASVVSFLAVLPAFAGLPVVDIDAGGVSARSAFGDEIKNTMTVAPLKKVVARRANKKADANHNLADAHVDILMPNLPSSNLWAENKIAEESPLRMPRMDEVAVLNNEFDLPDESLDSSFASADNTPVSRTQVMQELESTMKRMAEIDAQISKISELQRRADDSIKRSGVQQVAATKKDNAGRVARTIVAMDEPDVLVRSVEKHEVKKATSDNLADLSPAELRKAFRKTFLSENKHLSAMTDTYADSGDTTISVSQAGFTAESNLSEMDAGIRPFEIKVGFRNFDSALSRENYTLLTTFAGIVINDPKRAVQVLIPKDATTDSDTRKLTARRLAIIEQVLKDSGVSEQRIMPVLSNRDDDGALVLRNIDSTQYETLTQQQKGKYGKTTTKTYKSMTW